MPAKSSLIEAVSRAAEVSLKESAAIMELILDGMVRAIRAGDKVELRGFGSFGTRQRKPRTGRNPASEFAARGQARGCARMAGRE